MSQYYRSLKSVFENALISMYLEVSSLDRFVPTNVRTQLIKKFIKPKVKLDKYKIIKKELKRLSLTKDTVNLENEISKLLQNLGTYKAKGDAEALLFDFLGNVHVWTGLMVQLSSSASVAEPGNIYLLKDETFTKIDDLGNYLEPVNLFVYTRSEVELNDVLLKMKKDTRFHVNVSLTFSSHAKLDVLPAYGL
jgi:hypothetical protein